MSTFDAIQQAEADLTMAKEAYVKRHGWSLTCNTPGALWLWTRDFSPEDAERHQRWKERGPGPLGWPSEPKPYGRMTVALDGAVHMTRATLDQDEEELVEW